MCDTTIETVATLLRNAERPLFITGAGLSADSGLPTYRGVGGLYEQVDTEDGMPIEVALSGQTLRLRPDIAWRHLWRIGAACRAGTFNRGHSVIAEIEAAKPGTWTITQNVDGFHRAAGSRNLVELHGRIGTLRCVDCVAELDAAAFFSGCGVDLASIDPNEAPAGVLPPQCPNCGGLLRPEVVLFGEMLPVDAVVQLHEIQADRDLVLSIGTSSVFPYITGPVLRARALGVPTIEINPGRTSLSKAVDHWIGLRAADALERLWRRV